MALPRSPSFFYCALLLAFTACAPKIGEECVTNQDCSQQSDGRLCDTSQPGGYCTMADCDPTTCPEKESSCVSFAATRSTVGLCDNPGIPSPYRRNFCMKWCESSADCRSGYACEDISGANEFGATLVQKDPETDKICIAALSLPELDESEGSDQVCTAGRSSQSGAGGVGGAGGAQP